MRPILARALTASAAAIALATSGCDRIDAMRGERAAASAPAATATPSDQAELGTWGVETADMDPATRPGDDFFRYVNGRWLDTFEIPDEYSSYSSFTVLFERSEERVRSIIEKAVGSGGSGSERKIGDIYASFVDTAAIDALGLDPAAEDLARIAAAQTHEDIARLFADPVLGLESPFGAFVNVDAKNPDQYAVYLGQDGLGMPNRTYYVDEKFADKKAAYRKYVETMLTLAGIEDAAEKAGAILALEERMADAHWTPEKRRNRDLTYNPKTVAELAAYAPGAPWAAMFEAAGLGGLQTLVVREDDAIQRLAAIFAETPVATWRAYAAFHLLSGAADVLPATFDAAKFEFYGTTLRGTPQQRERWKRGVAEVNGALGEAVGEIYVARYFPAQSKAMMDTLVGNLRTAMDGRLAQLPWMSEETKREAKAKLEKFTAKIAYPDAWKDYSGLETAPGDAYGNRQRAAAWAWRDQIGKLGGPIDRTEWFMTPQTVNAYYSPTRNEIVFPAAILQAPFFDPNADPAVNYGAIGAVIGHEIGHGFDDQGRKSDGDGLLRDWWTEEDAARFQVLADKLGAQYGQYEPVPGFKVRPDLTMGENIGDLGGLAIAYHAYKLSLGGAEAPVIEGFTGDQRFFMAWAQVWKRKAREEALKNQIETDPHSPGEYRANGVVRNMDAWYDAFGVAEGDALYLAPEDRVQIW